MLYNILVHAHSGLRWIVLLLLLLSIINAARAMRDRRTLTSGESRMSVAGMGIVHLQFVIGMVLYLMSPKVQFSANTMGHALLRFFTVEHTLGMLVAVLLVTVAHRKGKTGNVKALFWLYIISMVVICVSIPWPFRGFGTGWF